MSWHAKLPSKLSDCCRKTLNTYLRGLNKPPEDNTLVFCHHCDDTRPFKYTRNANMFLQRFGKQP